MSTLLYENINLHPILHYHIMEAAEDGKYSTLAEMNSSKGADYINFEELINKLHIGLKTASRTLKSTTSWFVLSTGSFTRRFRTYKAYLRY